MRIATKLLVLSLVLSLVPLAIASGYAYIKAKEALEGEIVDQLRGVASAKGDRVEATLLVAEERRTLFAAEPALREAENASATEEALVRLLGRYVALDRATVYDAAGELVANAGLAVPAVESASPSRGPSLFLRGGELRLRTTGPMGTDGSLLVVESSAQAMLENLQDRSGLGETGETLLVGDLGRGPVYLVPLRFDPNAALERPVPADAAAAQAAARGEAGVFLAESDYRGLPAVAVARPVSGTDWGLVTKVNREEVFAPVEELRDTLVAFLLVATAVTSAAAYVVGRSFSEPIERLTASSSRIAAGDFDAPLEVHRNDEIGKLAVSFDRMASNLIEANRELEMKVAARTEELARSNRELQHFAYVASHDLQEPLRMVSSYTQLLARRYRGKLGPDADDFIDYAVDGAKRMQTLINDLLEYSRVDARKEPHTETSLNEAFDRALLSLAAAIEETGAEVTRDELPTISGVPTQWTQVFQNLVGNGMKFRRPDVRPVIRASAARVDGAWEIRVRDNGIGIPPEHRDRIFVLFQRLHGREEYSGTGIGLAICKKVVERHGGAIWVESAPDRGSTFVIRLPDPAAESASD